jgi:glycosyltransferase involved in cell wall biosynthesis
MVSSGAGYVAARVATDAEARGAVDPLRVLHVTPSLGVGGAERIVASLAVHHRRVGHEVGVIALYDQRKTWIEDELRSNEIPVWHLGKHLGLDVRMVPRIARAVARFHPNVVHSHSSHVLRYAIPAVLLSARCPIVHTVHNLAERETDRPGKLLQYLAFRAGIRTVAIGQAVAESMRRVYGLAPRHVVPNGIPIADFSHEWGPRDELRASLEVPAEAPTFVAVGRFMRQKNHEALLRAFASPRLRATNARLLLVGEGELRGALVETARALDLGERVRFLGVRSDIPRILQAADVFVLSSRWEGNPLAVMEAMAAGRPVVATAVGCIPELLSDATGRLVPPGDVAALEAAMFLFASDLAAARVAGAAAARMAQERFDVSRMAGGYAQVYLEAVRGASPARCA